MRIRHSDICFGAKGCIQHIKSVAYRHKGILYVRPFDFSHVHIQAHNGRRLKVMCQSAVLWALALFQRHRQQTRDCVLELICLQMSPDKTHK